MQIQKFSCGTKKANIITMFAFKSRDEKIGFICNTTNYFIYFTKAMAEGFSTYEGKPKFQELKRTTNQLIIISS
jgi:hypothetical protein